MNIGNISNGLVGKILSSAKLPSGPPAKPVVKALADGKSLEQLQRAMEGMAGGKASGNGGWMMARPQDNQTILKAAQALSKAAYIQILAEEIDRVQRSSIFWPDMQIASLNRRLQGMGGLARMLQKRQQMFEMLRQIVGKYNDTAKNAIQSMGR